MLDLYDYLCGMFLGPDVHVLAASMSDSGRQPLVKVVVDTSQGITIDGITEISRLLRRDSNLAQQVGTTEFRLEVTSPGVDASLQEFWQFPRHVGRRLAVRLNTPGGPDESQADYKGELLRTSTDGIVLRTAENDKEIAW